MTTTTTYKQTEIGAIPNDWVVKSLGKVGKIITGRTPSRANPTFWNGDFCWVSAQDFKQKYISNSVEKITAEGKKVARLIPENSVLVTCIASIGLNAINKVDCATNQQINSIILDKQNNAEFVYYQICHFSESLKKLAGQTAVPIINKGQIEQFQIPLPPTLADMDALLAALDKLIAKKKQIKIGAMQKLLAPQKDWETKKLGEIGEMTGAGVDKTVNDNEIPVRLLNYLDVFHRDFIYSNELNHWVTAKLDKIQKCDIKQGDVFFTPSSEMPYDIAISAVVMEDIPNACYSYHINRFRIFED